MNNFSLPPEHDCLRGRRNSKMPQVDFNGLGCFSPSFCAAGTILSTFNLRCMCGTILDLEEAENSAWKRYLLLILDDISYVGQVEKISLTIPNLWCLCVIVYPSVCFATEVTSVRLVC